MKKIISLIAFLVIVANLYSQKTTEYTLNSDYFGQKSKNQNAAGWILLGTVDILLINGKWSKNIEHSIIFVLSGKQSKHENNKS